LSKGSVQDGRKALMLYRPERGWGFTPQSAPGAAGPAGSSELEDLRQRVAELENSLKPGGG